MTLNDFRELVQNAGFKFWGGQYSIDVSLGRKPCATVSLTEYAYGWVNTQRIDDEIARAQLTSLVSEFINTPLNDRYKKVIAKHENGSYVKRLNVVMMGEPDLEIEMTNDISGANDRISARERDWLDDFFGYKISYIEEY